MVLFVDLHYRGRVAGTQAFDLLQREEAILCGLACLDSKFLFKAVLDIPAPPERAGQGAADLQQVFPISLPAVVGVEGCLLYTSDAADE